MNLIGLTGGVGMGKSACAELLSRHGVPIIDTDELARQVVEPGQPALAEVSRLFGPGVIELGGRLNRKALGHRVFSDSFARQQLENLLHPLIRSLWRAQVAEWNREKRQLGVVVIPLLFETKAETEFGCTLCVACSLETQRQRLLARGWTPQQISQRIDAQLPIETKLRQSSFVIWTEGGLEIHAKQLDLILERLPGRSD